MVFRSRVDSGLAVVAVAGPLATLVIVLFAVIRGREPILSALFVVLIGGGVVVLLAWVFVSTKYDVESDLLTIRSGPFRWRIPTPDIISVTQSNSALSSPALSLDRLRIHYRAAGAEKDILVSPKEMEGFISALRRANPSIRTG